MIALAISAWLACAATAYLIIRAARIKDSGGWMVMEQRFYLLMSIALGPVTLLASIVIYMMSGESAERPAKW